MASHRKFPRLMMALAAGAVVLAPAAASFGQSYYYDNDRSRYYDNDQARRDYDARYGYGAYDRYYANQGGYYSDRDRVRRDYDARYGDGAYDRYYGASADRTYREDRRECRKDKDNNTAAGAVLGGIAGAVIGSNLASGGGRTGGAIIGGVAGAAGGSAIARGTVHCND
jgi:hypothetical protein